MTIQHTNFRHVAARQNLQVMFQGAALHDLVIADFVHGQAKENIIFQSCVLNPSLLCGVGCASLSPSKSVG